MKQVQIDGGCQFFTDLENSANNSVNKGMFNLICTRRDLALYSKGIKPHRRWKISDVKRYFGMNGNKETLLEKIDLLYKVITEQRGQA